MRRRPPLPRILRAAVVAFQLALLALLVVTAATYGVVYITSWLDDVAYHVPAAVRIAQHWNPYFVDSPVDSHWYPAGAETFAALFVLATSSIRSTNVSGALCFIALCGLVYVFAGLWTRDLVARLSSVVCAASIPLLLGQCLAFYVDIHFAFLVCAALYLTCASLMRREAQFAYAGLAVAVLGASVKYSGLIALAVLAPASLACAWMAPAPRRPRWRAALLLLAAIVFTSGFYGRNWLYRGNPLYPFALPTWLQPIARLSPAPYEADPELLGALPTLQRAAVPPHPWLPASWPKVELTPDMTDDAFGVAGALALLGTAASLLFLHRLEASRRRAWLLVVGAGALLVGIFPEHASNPRYVLFLPILASLSPSVLAPLAGGRAARVALGVFIAAILASSAAYAYTTFVAEKTAWTSLRQAGSLLVPYRPIGMPIVDYARWGHLRIGYTSGFRNMIALLYDSDLTNQLIPLHYKNYELNHWREFDTPEEFLAYVQSLDLDGIEIFDLRYPGTDLLQEHFPGITHVWRSRAAARLAPQ